MNMGLLEVRVQSKNEVHKPKTTRSKVFSEIFKDYCSNASLHGIGYLGARDKTVFEKVWWLLVFITSLILCSYLISRTWMKWVNSPVIVSFAKGQTPLWEIPFPAVTICPMNKVQQNIYNYTKYFQKRKTLKGEERKFFWDVSLVCNLDFYGISGTDADITTNEDAIKNIIKVSSSNFIEMVSWQYNNVQVDDFFSPQLTAEGLCFSSNSLSQQDMFTDKFNQDIPYITQNKSNYGWDIESGYTPGLDVQVYPRRTTQDGYESGLGLSLKTYVKETDYLCGIPVSGYKLILHNPAELPRAAQKFMLIPIDRHIAVTVTPQLLTTSPGLLSISPKIRNCYFSREKTLFFFKIYTQNNCKMECIANMTKEHCGCVTFFLPRDNNTLICGLGQLNCSERIRDLLPLYEMLQRENKVTEDMKKSIVFQIYEKCNCMASCAMLHYSAETSQATAHYVQTMISAEKNSYLDSKLTDPILKGEVILTQVDIFFKENHLIAAHRSELFGPIDFLANCGGLLGLFLGFSLLSIIEIFYFLTIRVYFKMKLMKRNEEVNQKGIFIP